MTHSSRQTNDSTPGSDGGTFNYEQRVYRLYEAVRALTSELSLDVVLQKVADLSRELVGSSYAALGVLGSDGKLSQFITSGISQDDRKEIGHPPEGSGVLGVVIREGKTLRLRRINEHPESVGFPDNHPNMSSFLGAPIVFKDRVLGDLYLANKIGAEEFSDEDETVVTLFAAQAAVAIANAQLFQIEARRSAQLKALNRIGGEFSRILELDELLQTVTEELRSSFDYQNIQVFWVDQASGSLQLEAKVGSTQGPAMIGSAYPISEGVIGWVARNGVTKLVNDQQQAGEMLESSRSKPGSEVVVPVVCQEAVVAVISVAAAEPKAFDESDVQTLETVAYQLGVAIDNIELYRQQGEQSRRLAVAEERDRIGRDLHDGVIQSIYAVGLTLEDIAFQVTEDAESARNRLDGVVGDLNQVIGDIRSYISDLRPRELQGRQFGEALFSLVADLEDRAAVSVSLEAPFDLDELPERHVINLWHILQEAFSNIEKYAQARQVQVALTSGSSSLNLLIADDGVGFDLEMVELGNGYGLPNIKDRAEKLGGVLRVLSQPGSGTKLDINIPISESLVLSQHRTQQRTRSTHDSA